MCRQAEANAAADDSAVRWHAGERGGGQASSNPCGGRTRGVEAAHRACRWRVCWWCLRPWSWCRAIRPRTSTECALWSLKAGSTRSVSGNHFARLGNAGHMVQAEHEVSVLA